MNESARKGSINVNLVAVITATGGVLCFSQIMNLKGNWSFMFTVALQHIKAPRLPDAVVKNENSAVYLFLIICWIPVLLAVYPGFLSMTR